MNYEVRILLTCKKVTSHLAEKGFKIIWTVVDYSWTGITPFEEGQPKFINSAIYQENLRFLYGAFFNQNSKQFPIMVALIRGCG
jgi:hypothetical protein